MASMFLTLTYIRIYSVGVWNVNILKKHEYKEVLEFTPLEFETKKW